MVRLTSRPDMTLDVYIGRKTTMQQQQQCMCSLVVALTCQPTAALETQVCEENRNKSCTVLYCQGMTAGYFSLNRTESPTVSLKDRQAP